MGFKSVYQRLMEVFPQVDSRILKAVAIEHSKDVDAAAEIVLLEVLPCLSKSMVSNPSQKEYNPSGASNGHAGHGKHVVQTSVFNKRQVGVEKTASSSSEPRLEEEGNSRIYQDDAQNPLTFLSCDTNLISNQLQENMENEQLILLQKPRHQEDDGLSVSNQTSKSASNSLMCEKNADLSQICTRTEGEVAASSSKCQDINFQAVKEQIRQVMSTSLIQENGELCGSLTGHHCESKDFDGPVVEDFDMVVCGKSPQIESCLNGTVLEMENSVVEQTLDATAGLHLEFCGTPVNDFEIVNSKQDIKIDLLEEMVEAARNNKKTLFSAMESVMNMMRETELQEQAAEQAKEEAARGGSDILVQVEELKQMLGHAKEANDTHAGEVYGEKAILATEVRELRARLLSLSDERDKALAILDEMHLILEARLAAAKEARKEAEQEKLEKEKSARNALSEQEAIMEKVVQESKFLKREAEENSKLREFLIDRGRAVDILQGEMSVICQDVKLLKEKFDERVPLSESISSSQTSCILASGSLVRSMTPDLLPEVAETSKCPTERSPESSLDGRASKTPTERSPASSVDSRRSKSPTERSPAPSADGRTSKSPTERSPASSVDGRTSKSSSEEERIVAIRKELLEDGWDFFENDTEM